MLEATVNRLNRLALLSDEALAVAEDYEMATMLWESPDIGDLAAEEFISAVGAARERFRGLLALPVVGIDTSEDGR